MNRRSFLAAVAALPVASAGLQIRELRHQFLLDGVAEVQMILTAHFTDSSAERWRRGWATRAFEGQGEWYLQTSKELELPANLANLPGTLMHHTYVAGAASVESAMLVGAFRRDHIACTFRVEGDAEYMLALGNFFASQRIPEPVELLWADAQLHAFIPTADAIGMEVEPSEAFWP